MPPSGHPKRGRKPREKPPRDHAGRVSSLTLSEVCRAALLKAGVAADEKATQLLIREVDRLAQFEGVLEKDGHAVKLVRTSFYLPDLTKVRLKRLAKVWGVSERVAAEMVIRPLVRRILGQETVSYPEPTRFDLHASRRKRRPLR